MSAPANARPGPQRALWAAVLLPPLVWIAQGTIGWYLGGHGCAAVKPALASRSVQLAVLMVSTAAIAMVVASLGVAARHRKRNDGHRGSTAAVERSRFIATLAIVAGVTLLFGLLLAGLPALMVQTCGQAR